MGLLKYVFVVIAIFNIFGRISTNQLVNSTNEIIKLPRNNDCTRPGVFCSDYYSAIRFCTGAGASSTLLKTCSGTNQPYCEILSNGAGQCSSTRNSQCPSSTFEFLCNTEEHLPDTSNCAQYYYCGGSGIPSELNVCPTGSYYDSYTESCKTGKVICYSTKCPANSFGGDLIAFKMNPNFYTLCLGENRIVYRCPENHIWNGSSCVFQCTSIGRFPDPIHCRRYYDCKKKTGTGVVQQCFDNQYYDAGRQGCEIDNKEPPFNCDI